MAVEVAAAAAAVVVEDDNDHARDRNIAPATNVGDIARAYKAVEEPNAYRPADFRTALKSAAGAIGRLQ